MGKSFPFADGLPGNEQVSYDRSRRSGIESTTRTILEVIEHSHASRHKIGGQTIKNEKSCRNDTYEENNPI